MSEHIEDIEPYDAVLGYLAKLNKVEYMGTVRRSEELTDKGNEAFRTQAFDALVLVPMLLTQEQGIANTVDQIRQQHSNAGIIISENIPATGTELALPKQNIRDTVEYQHDHPEVPLSYFIEAYTVGTPFGQVLRDLYGSSMCNAASYQRRRLRNIPLIRWDFDTVRASDNYIPDTITEHQNNVDPNLVTYPRVQHDRLDPALFPNLNRLLDWYDESIRLASSVLPAHFAVDLVGYATSGGIHARCTMGETSDLIEAMDRKRGTPYARLQPIDNAVATVSCRNIVYESVHRGYAMYKAIRVEPDGATHRTQTVATDISVEEYLRQGTWRIVNILHKHGDVVYQTQTRKGVPHTEAVRASTAAMRSFGELALRRYGDPGPMFDVMAKAITSWSLSGPPVGTVRRQAKPTPDSFVEILRQLFG